MVLDRSCIPSLEYGAPQGSDIGPFSFSKYSSSIAKIAVCYHLCADDTQLYVVFSAGDGPAAAAQLGACIKEIRKWMTGNMLKLSDKKKNSL